MASEWPVITFGELIQLGELEIGDGYRAKNSELTGDGLIFLRAGHVTDTHIDFNGTDRFCTTAEHTFGPKISRPGDVIVTTKGNSTGRLAFVTSDMPRFIYSPHLSYWRAAPKGRLEQAFLRAWSRGTQFSKQLAALSRSTDMAPYLSLTDQRTLSVTIPPKPIQRWVGALNDSVDQRLQLLRQTNTTLEAIAQALFKSWFVDFDPVRAKAEGRAPEAADAATAALFPSEFEDSELGLIPKGWRVKRLSDLVELAYGKALKASDRVVGEIPVYGSGGVTGWHDVALVKGPTIIVGRKGSVGTIYWEDRPCHPIDTVFFVRSQEAPLTLCLQVLRSLGLDKMNTDAAVPGLNRENAYRLEVVAAPTAVNEAWRNIAEPIYAAMSNNSRRREVLSQLRDTLLPRLISGKLRLPDVQALIEEATP